MKDKRRVLIVCRSHDRAVHAMYSALEENRAKVNEGLLQKVEIRRVRGEIETDDEIIFYRSQHAITPSFALGRYFDAIYGMDNIDDSDTRAQLRARLKP